jgi:hypothetical protein
VEAKVAELQGKDIATLGTEKTLNRRSYGGGSECREFYQCRIVWCIISRVDSNARRTLFEYCYCTATQGCELYYISGCFYHSSGIGLRWNDRRIHDDAENPSLRGTQTENKGFNA